LTSRLPVTGLATLPANLSADASVYVKPLSLSPRSEPVLGGMDVQAEVLVRGATNVASIVCTWDALRVWSASLSDAQVLSITRQVDRMESPCSAVAGLDMNHCHVMGIINATPDSFSDGGKALAPEHAEAQAILMLEAGATLLDVGGESTRPGARPVPLDAELDRVVPVVERLTALGVPVSIDSRNAPVIAAALDAGAAIVNDVSALTHDPTTVELIARRGVPVVLMHALGDPRTMQEAPAYDHVSLDVFDYLESRIKVCLNAGIARESIVVDPGIGFGKTLEHNLTLLRDLALFRALGCPILLGASRKRFIGTLTGEQQAGRRVAGSVAAALAGASAGARFLRVHDVLETVQALRVWQGIEGMERS
jgi:dihydropteroate synthase